MIALFFAGIVTVLSPTTLQGPPAMIPTPRGAGDNGASLTVERQRFDIKLRGGIGHLPSPDACVITARTKNIQGSTFCLLTVSQAASRKAELDAAYDATAPGDCVIGTMDPALNEFACGYVKRAP